MISEHLSYHNCQNKLTGQAKPKYKRYEHRLSYSKYTSEDYINKSEIHFASKLKHNIEKL